MRWYKQSAMSNDGTNDSTGLYPWGRDEEVHTTDVSNQTSNTSKVNPSKGKKAKGKLPPYPQDAARPNAASSDPKDMQGV